MYRDEYFCIFSYQTFYFKIYKINYRNGVYIVHDNDVIYVYVALYHIKKYKYLQFYNNTFLFLFYLEHINNFYWFICKVSLILFYSLKTILFVRIIFSHYYRFLFFSHILRSSGEILKSYASLAKRDLLFISISFIQTRYTFFFITFFS